MDDISAVNLDDAGFGQHLGECSRWFRSVVGPAGRNPTPRVVGPHYWRARDTDPVVRDVVGVGQVEQWNEVTEIALPCVSFRHSYRFARDGLLLTSDSTLRFRSRDEFEKSLATTGFRVLDVRDAPDRPGREYVFVAERT